MLERARLLSSIPDRKLTANYQTTPSLCTSPGYSMVHKGIVLCARLVLAGRLPGRYPRSIIRNHDSVKRLVKVYTQTLTYTKTDKMISV